MDWICENCGSSIEDDDEICEECGSDVSDISGQEFWVCSCGCESGMHYEQCHECGCDRPD